MLICRTNLFVQQVYFLWLREYHHLPPCIPPTVGISGCCASLRNVPDLRIQGTFLYLLFFRPFYFYPLSFCSLQYIYENLYHSYPSVCLCNPQRQPEILFLTFSWSRDFDFNTNNQIRAANDAEDIKCPQSQSDAGRGFWVCRRRLLGASNRGRQDESWPTDHIPWCQWVSVCHVPQSDRAKRGPNLDNTLVWDGERQYGTHEITPGHWYLTDMYVI